MLSANAIEWIRKWLAILLSNICGGDIRSLKIVSRLEGEGVQLIEVGVVEIPKVIGLG